MVQKKFSRSVVTTQLIFKIVRKRVKKTENVTGQVTNFVGGSDGGKTEIIKVTDGLLHILGRNAANR